MALGLIANCSYMMEERILVVDDEKDICDILQFNLEQEGYLVRMWPFRQKRPFRC